MLKHIKEIFSFDNVVSCFIEAIGYGLGYVVPESMGANTITCLICCMAVGIIFSLIMDKVLGLYFKSVSKGAEVFTAIIVFFIYLCFWYLTKFGLDYDLDIEIAFNFLTIVCIHIIGLLINLALKILKK